MLKSVKKKQKKDKKDKESKKKAEKALDKKEAYESRQHDKIDSFIKESHREGEEEAVAQHAKDIGMPYLDLHVFPVDQENLSLVKEKDAKKYGVVVLRRFGNEVKMGVLDPKNEETADFINQLEKDEDLDITQYLVSKSSIERAWENYKSIGLLERLDSMKVKLDRESLAQFEKEIKNLVDLEKKIKKISTTEIISIIIAGAVKLGASDIHFEPYKEGNIRLRYRVDGVLQDVAEFEGSFYPSVLSRIKMLSDMMINVRDVAQDGRFSIASKGDEEIDVRVSMLPGNHGESIVMRLLNQDISELQIEKLGLEGAAYKRLVNESEKKQGMIINSGPTGSGKTTTLYAIINMINTPDKKIITIEDPVEYKIKNIVQTQVEEERGFSFANGLRSIMRQDPDIILVGEIRDEETASIAIQSALTGHLVLSTIHANTSAGVIPRLIDLGIKPTLINSSLNVCVAQRLVRKLCEHCKEKYKPAPETVDILKKMVSLISPKAKVKIPKKVDYLWRSKGCPKCRGIGYKSRIGIFEILKLTERVKEKIERMESAESITSSALEDGMITMEQDGIIKTLKGYTSMEELTRVVGKGDYLLQMYEKIVIQALSRDVLVEKEIYEKVKDIKEDYNALRVVIQNAEPADVIKYVLLIGLLMDAGDVHIEPGKENFKIRYRIDGVLQDIVELPMNEFLSLLNEIKTFLDVSIEKREGSIDGRFGIALDQSIEEVPKSKVDVRVSIILGGYGDIVVMRLLSQDFESVNFEKLGFRKLNYSKIEQEMKKPNGMIINTGPTGSGKTTTLYSILKVLNKPEIKIITVEDPIEYQMKGVLQTQVNKEEGYTFANALRSILRQNPDVIMIGEVRDKETAKIAYQSALAGHLVLTTLHTNDAPSSVQRLLNMGVNTSDVISGTNCFIAQRLTRKLCEKCKKKVKMTSEEKKHIKEVFQEAPDPIDLSKYKMDYKYEAVGCKHCHGFGYEGRLPVAEVLQIDKNMEKFLKEKPTTSEIRSEAIKNGMLTLRQDGYLRVLSGETTIEEVGRVAGY